MLSIEPSVFDCDDVLLIFHGDFPRETVLSALGVSDVSWVAWKLDGGMTLRLWTKNEREATDNLTKIIGVDPSGRALTPGKRRQPVSIIDLSIMDTLVNDPRVSFGEIIKSTGLSPKTVRKHLAHLLETKTISITPLLGTLADSGDLIYPLIVTGRTSISDMRRIMGEPVLVHHTQNPPMKYMLCKESSLTDVITKTRTLEKVQGVESVTISLNREMLVSTELRHYLIQEEIRKLKKDRTS
jgi:hypothetical protein